MRTTIDIPDDLLRRAKAVAALRGIKLKDLISGLIEQGLSPRPKETEARGQKRPVPVTITAEGLKIKPLTNAEIEDIFMQEDMERLGLNRSA